MLCPVPCGDTGRGSVCTRVCALGTVIYTCLFVHLSICVCIDPAIYLSITHPCSYLSYIYKLSLLASLVVMPICPSFNNWILIFQQ